MRAEATVLCPACGEIEEVPVRIERVTVGSQMPQHPAGSAWWALTVQFAPVVVPHDLSACRRREEARSDGRFADRQV